jgi:acetylornithine deacetylase
MCLNIARLDGGVAFNVVPAEARLSASLRPPPGAALAPLADELTALARAASPSATVTVRLANPSFHTRDRRGFDRWLGASDAGIDLGFWTEAAVFQESNIDAVVFGPGNIAQAHAPDEWVARSELEAARRAFVRVLSG